MNVERAIVDNKSRDTVLINNAAINDRVPPVTTAEVNGQGTGGVHAGELTVALVAVAGVKRTECSLDGGPGTNVLAPERPQPLATLNRQFQEDLSALGSGVLQPGQTATSEALRIPPTPDRLLPDLTGERKPETRTITWRFPLPPPEIDGCVWAVGKDDWKPVRENVRRHGPRITLGKTRTGLYHMREDLAEKNDLSDCNANPRNELLAIDDAWNESLPVPRTEDRIRR